MRIVLAYWWKGLKYAAMSLCAIYAGYVIQIKEIKEYGDLFSSDLGVLIIPALASACFFICYTVRFNPEESTDFDRATSSAKRIKTTEALIRELGYEPLQMGIGRNEFAWMNQAIFDSLHHSSVVIVDLTALRPVTLPSLGPIISRNFRSLTSSPKRYQAKVENSGSC